MDGVTRAEVGLEISLSTLPASSSADELGVELPSMRARTTTTSGSTCAPAPAAHTWDCYVEPLLSAYGEVLRRNGSEAAAAIFACPPVPSRIARVDTTIGVLAGYLGDRDGWPTPGWARDLAAEAARDLSAATPWWFVSDRRGPHASALMEAPPVFRRVRVFVRAAALDQGTST